jgi:tetratricopeptide (TPR) repeat protein
VPYLRERHSDVEPLYPHGLELRLLVQTGVVGTLLFAGFLTCALAGVWRSIRRSKGFIRGLTGVATVSFAYWFVHGSVDWFWEMPALGAPAFAWLGLSLRTTAENDRSEVEASGARPRVRRLYAPAVALLALPAAATLALPWLAAKEVDAAAAGWRAKPQRAFDELRLARRLNPLSDRPDMVAEVIAGRLGERDRQRAALERALQRNGNNWYAYLELGILDSLAGRQAAATADLRQAVLLNPTDPVVLEVARRTKTGRRVSPALIRRLLGERFQILTGKRQR